MLMCWWIIVKATLFSCLSIVRPKTGSIKKRHLMVFDDVMKCHPRLCHKNVLQCSIDSHNPLFVTKLSLGGCARKYNQKVQSPKCHWKVMPPKWLSDISQKCHWEPPYLQRLYRNPHHQGAFLFVVLPGSDECTLNADCVDDSHLVFPKYVVSFVFTNIKWRLSSLRMLSRFFVSSTRLRIRPNMLPYLFILKTTI